MTDRINTAIALAAQRRRRAASPPPAVSTPEQIDKAVRLAAARAMRRSEKLCACCGAMTAPLAQFWNQDTGYGLCGPCANWIERREGAEYLAANYGKRGIHIEGREVLNHGKL
jgi:hypothetical protein